MGKKARDQLQAADAPKPFLSAAELASRWGVSESTIRRLHHTGRIRGYQPGGPRARLIFPADTLEQLIRLATSLPSLPSARPARGPGPSWRKP